MNISKVCIDRPVFTTVISLVLVLLGLLGLDQLTLSANPVVFRPKLVVTVDAPGSSAEYVEKNITIPLENSLETTPYLSFTSSTSAEDNSEIDLYFKNITPEQYLTAQSTVLQAVSEVQLPSNANPPEIRTSSHDGSQLMVFAISAPHMSQQALVDYVQNNIVRSVQQVPGVGSVQQFSTLDALRINLNPLKMAEQNVNVSDVLNALKNNNLSAQAGSIINSQQAIPITLDSSLDSIKQFQNVILKQTADSIIRIKDIASITISSEDFGGAYTFYNGKQGAGVGIIASDDANPIQVGNELRKMLAKMQQTFPPGMQIHMMWDQAKLIQHSVEEVFWTIFEAIILVALVTLLFLGNWRFAMIPFVTIPICIISSFSIMWVLGFSINLMTLLALVLAVGLVVDDAIVVLENCHRHVESGLSPFNAAFKSMKEITFPVIGMTISIIAVYIPTAFMSGKTAVFFQQFAFTLAGAVFISGIVALTLTPMMCSRLMSKISAHGYDAFLEKIFTQLRMHYQRVLSWILKHKWLPISIFIGFVIVGLYIFKLLPTTSIPDEYGGYIFLGIQAPQTASVAYTENIAKSVIKTLLEQPSVESIMSFGGGDDDSDAFGMNIIKLKPGYQGFDTNLKIATQFGALFPNLTTAQIFSVPLNVNGDQSGGEQPGQIAAYVIGFADYNELANDVKNYVAALQKTDMFQQVQNNLQFNSQQMTIHIDRIKASQLNVNIDDIDTALSTFLGGYTFTQGYQFNGVNYPVIVQLPASDMKDLSILNNMYVNNSDNQQINLNQLVSVNSTVEMPIRTHINSMRAGEVDVVANSQYTAGQAIATLLAVGKATLPPGMSVTFSQRELDILSGNNMLALIFALGIIFIYLILAALFESFIDPLIILLTVPLCIIGALAMLYLIGGSLNIYTGIGLVTLIGLVSKHGVLITQFANDILLSKKVSAFDAIIAAASIRIRPILMTSATMIVGAVPLVCSSGIGSNSRSQLGWVIIAGLLLGTFFSLFVVPVAYLLLNKLKRNRILLAEDSV